MARFARHTSPPRSIRKIAHAYFDDAGAALRRMRRGGGVHDARKALKKLRAVLRLVRSALPRRVYEAENARLRDLGRQLSAARDAEVLADLARTPQFLGALPATRARRALVRSFDGDRRQARAAMRRPDALGAFRDGLAEARHAVRGWTPSSIDGRTIVRGLSRCYRRARAAARAAAAGHDAGRWHECRKRAKDVAYQLHLLRRIWPVMVTAAEEQFQRLTDGLGEAHDLAAAADRLRASRPPGVGAGEARRFATAMGRRRRMLQDEARTLAAALFDEKPGDFRRRMAACWEAWRG